MSDNKKISNANTQGVGKGGNMPPKERQFGQPNGNPQGRGFWKKEDTPRWWLESMMKMDEIELDKIYNDKDSSVFKKKMAKCIMDGEWREIKEMIQEVYGKPKETVIHKVEVEDPYDGLTTDELKTILQTKPTETEQK